MRPEHAVAGSSPAAPAEGGGGVLIVDDHGLLAEALALSLRAEGSDAEAIVPASVDAVLAAVEQHRPRLVLLDVDLGFGDTTGVELVPSLRALGAAVLVLTGSRDPLVLGACLEAGAVGLASKASPFSVLVDLVQRAARGEDLPGRRLREHLLAELGRHRQEEAQRLRPFQALTPREAAVLEALLEGRSAEAIAAASYVSLATVRSQIRGVLTKLGVSSQLGAVAMARRAGWQRAAESSTLAR
jgi:DNA-binding NarL/FixJ family response regulator